MTSMDGQCDWGTEAPHARNHILTTLNPPSTVELCDEHYGIGMIPLVAAELGLDPGGLYSVVEKFAKREQAKADKAAAAAEAAQAEAADYPDTGDDEVPADAGLPEAKVADQESDHVDGPTVGDGLPDPQFYPADGPAYSETGGGAA